MDSKPMFLFKMMAVACVLVMIVCLAADALAEPMRVKSVQASGGLRVRREPSINANVVYLLEDTETAIILAEADGWSLVAKNNGEHSPLGWACSDYLK